MADRQVRQSAGMKPARAATNGVLIISGKPGDPIGAGRFLLDTVNAGQRRSDRADLESTDAKDTQPDEARVFIKRIKEKTGRYPGVDVMPTMKWPKRSHSNTAR